MIAKFWWGAKNGKRKMHSRKWEVKTRSKMDGDFRFRELQAINAAMLSNMATRVMNEPNTLWVRVFKGIYFPNNDFLNATKGSRVFGG